MATELYPFKGSAIWNKSSGIVQVSGMVPPMSDAATLGAGSVVNVIFAGQINGDEVIYVEVVNIELVDWRCTPTGWTFSGRSVVVKDVIGEYVSVFECEAQYRSKSTDRELDDYLDSLTVYDTTNTRRTTTPYSAPRTGWWRLSDIAKYWAIPELADCYIQSLTLTDYASQAQIVTSHVPLNEQLFLVDAYTQSVSMIPEVFNVVYAGMHDITLTEFMDLTRVGSVDLTGGRGCPYEDPRQDGVGSLMMAVKSTELDAWAKQSDDRRLVAPFVTNVIDQNTSATWMTDSRRQSNYQRLELYRYLGSRPTALPPEIKEWIKDLVVPDAQSSIYDKIVDLSFEYNTSFFDKYAATQNAYVGLSYTFVKYHPDVTPFKHSSAFPIETYQLSVRRDDLVLKGLLDGLNIDTHVYLDSVGFKPEAYPWEPQLIPDPNAGGSSEDDEDEKPGGGIGINSTLYAEFDESKFIAARVTTTQVYLEDTCKSVLTDGDTGGDPYMFEKSAEETVQYQLGPFLLNLESMFWVTPDASTDVGALDPRGVRVWMGPFDSPEKYALTVSTILTLYDLYKEYDGDQLYEALCIFARHGNLLKEADIVIAAICDELSKDSPMEYVRRFEQYYSTVNNWFDGQFSRMNGLQYSYSGSHGGLGEAIAALAEKQGVSNIDEILGRILPGSRVADAQDRAGGAYCLDMTRWMSENGIIRMAYGLDHKPARCEDREEGDECTDQEIADQYDEKLVRWAQPLEESRSVTTFFPGMTRIETYKLGGDMSVQEVPAEHHPELVYVSPKYIQVSTIESTPDDPESPDPDSDDAADPESTAGDDSGSAGTGDSGGGTSGDTGDEGEGDGGTPAADAHIILPTKVTRWDTLFDLQTAYTDRLLGKDLRMAERETDYTDNPSLIQTDLYECFADPTIRRFKLSVSSDCVVSIGTSQIVEYQEEQGTITPDPINDSGWDSDGSTYSPDGYDTEAYA